MDGVYQRVALERLDGADGSGEGRLPPEVAEVERGIYHALLEEGATREKKRRGQCVRTCSQNLFAGLIMPGFLPPKLRKLSAGST